MNILIIIVGAIGCVTLLAGLVFVENTGIKYTVIVFSLLLEVIFLAGLEVYTFTPQAMDVYRGRTTLEVTYIDGVPVDSAVIFKNNTYVK